MSCKKSIFLFWAVVLALSGTFFTFNFPENKKVIDPNDSLITVIGKLHVKLFPGPPEYSSIENGDRKDYCWVLELDKPSFLLALNMPSNELSLDLSNILKHQSPHIMALHINEEMMKSYRNLQQKQVAVSGHLFHAHTTHHYTPLLLEVKHIVNIESNFSYESMTF